MFSKAVSVGRRWKNWKTVPMLWRRQWASWSRSRVDSFWPASQTSPSSGGMTPLRQCRSVDLPSPDAPRRATRSPGWMARSMSAKSWRGPKLFAMPWQRSGCWSFMT